MGGRESGLPSGEEGGVIVEVTGGGVGAATSGTGKDYVQGRTKDEKRDHTGQVNQPGRRREVGGEGKFLGTSCDGCPGGNS